jgi:hypothetical protein
MEESFDEKTLVSKVSQFTKVEKSKLVEITDEMLQDKEKASLLKELKKYKYSLQYIIT